MVLVNVLDVDDNDVVVPVDVEVSVADVELSVVDVDVCVEELVTLV